MHKKFLRTSTALVASFLIALTHYPTGARSMEDDAGKYTVVLRTNAKISPGHVFAHNVRLFRWTEPHSRPFFDLERKNFEANNQTDRPTKEVRGTRKNTHLPTSVPPEAFIDSVYEFWMPGDFTTGSLTFRLILAEKPWGFVGCCDYMLKTGVFKVDTSASSYQPKLKFRKGWNLPDLGDNMD